jgi:DNA modification methylase
MGSGTTAIAAHNTGRKCVGIEKEDEYLTIAKRRIDYWENQPKQIEMGI